LIVLDANVVVSAVAGTYTRAELGRAVAAGVELAIPEPQILEALRVLTVKIGLADADAEDALADLTDDVRILDQIVYEDYEAVARAHLHGRGQRDWPVLAAALAIGGGIWSNDRDFFGVGVPVWSTRNIRFAEPQ
jgi:predicted nucleic acid-binding protein